LLPRHTVAQRPLLAVYPRAGTVPQKVEIFVEFLTNWVNTHEINQRSSRMPTSASRL
jgi:hypothetical protein